MKKILIAAVLIAACCPMKGQNIQLHYDLGSALYKNHGPHGTNLSSRPTLTSTVEYFKSDSWGNTFFFIDMDYGVKKDAAGNDAGGGVLGAYWEIYREFRFWEAPIYGHVEYNGGRGDTIFDDAWLAGATWSVANEDFSKTFSLSAMYKLIPRNTETEHNFQLTAVWELSFFNRALTLCGFADYWQEHRTWQDTRMIFAAEPQIWWNLNTLKGMENINLSVGSEVEVSCNFAGKGWFAVPTIGVKWTL